MRNYQKENRNVSKLDYQGSASQQSSREIFKKLTSRPSIARLKSLHISNGIGSFSDTLSALRLPSVRTSTVSSTPCIAIPKNKLNSAHPAILSSFTRIRRRLLPPGKPVAPCALMRTAADGVRISKRKKTMDGSA